MIARYRTQGQAQGAPTTSIYGQGVRRSLAQLSGHPAPLVYGHKMEKARVGVVFVQGYGKVLVTQKNKAYTGILPVRQQPQFSRPNPWSDPNRGRA